MNRCSLHCIMPPFILKRLIESGTPQQRDRALKALLSSTTLRSDRRFKSKLKIMVSRNADTGKQRSVYDCRTSGTTSDAVLIRSENDRSNGDVVANEAFEGVGKTYDFYSEIFRRNSIDGEGMRLDSYIHYGENYANAMWDGERMIFGDGDDFLFSRLTKSLDIIGHELTHGVTQYIAGLAYRGQSGALNESISDVFGTLVKQWSLSQTVDQADWLIGADTWSPHITGDALRSMKSPGKAYDDPTIGSDPQPAHMRAYQRLPETPDQDMGGVHINSGIPNHAFYLFATSVHGHAWETPGQIWYQALKQSKTDTDFQSFANMTYAVAGEKFDWNSGIPQALQEAWSQVGISVGKKGIAELSKEGMKSDSVQTDLIVAISGLSDQIAMLQKRFEAFERNRL